MPLRAPKTIFFLSFLWEVDVELIMRINEDVEYLVGAISLCPSLR
jgi:hypothetical protein